MPSAEKCHIPAGMRSAGELPLPDTRGYPKIRGQVKQNGIVYEGWKGWMIPPPRTSSPS